VLAKPCGGDDLQSVIGTILVRSKLQNLPTVDWANVNWLYVGVLAVFVFFSTFIGMLLSFKRAFRSALLSALLFAAAFVFWNYYPHGLPLPTMITTQNAPVPAASADRSAQVKPAQPDTTINRPPGNSQ
jgi:hypothetical protein